MTKRIIKCTNCKNVFFTNKEILTNAKLGYKKAQLNTELKKFTDDLITLQTKLSKINKDIKTTKITIKEINKDISNLNTKVQCRKCGSRLNALECEIDA